MTGDIKAYTCDGKFSDKFPQHNASSIRHFFNKTSQVGSIKWGSSLRWKSDRFMHLNSKKKSRKIKTGRSGEH